MKSFFILFLWIGTTLMIGQTNINNDFNSSNNLTYDTTKVLNVYSSPTGNSYIEKSIKGHKYYIEDYKIAEIYVDDRMIHKYAVRYDAYHDQIEVVENDKKFVLSKENKIRVVLKDYEYGILLNKKGVEEYFVIFNKDKETSLVLKARKKIEDAKKPQSGFEKYRPPAFYRDYSYFIKNNSGDLKKVRLKKNSILAVLKDKKEELEKFASSKKLKFKKEADLIKIIDYYNTL
ncbi:hypothetical protein [Aquimarina megaterium]|uniref:hypothetical protein n=1 Tax=Aquimarina megaterium TaxID=1443666 RepID=UPI000470F09F|nr:hypothetical protein [Aquimarina megaterium]